MLLWEALRAIQKANTGKAKAPSAPLPTSHSRRLPYDKRCAAITRQGHRCKGKIREGTECCLFHDPAWREQMRLKLANGLIRRRRRLSHLPDGYLKKLSNRTSVGSAMDRLYREIRLGLITPQMGMVMFTILTRLLDSGLVDKIDGAGTTKLLEAGSQKSRRRTGKAERMRPQLQDILTRSERTAWRKAVAEAPEAFLLTDNGKQPLPLLPVPSRSAEDGKNRTKVLVRQTAS